MDKQTEEIFRKIEEAEYVLVGLGQEFDMEFFLHAEKITAESGNSYNSRMLLCWWTLCGRTCSADSICRRWKHEMTKGLQKLAEVLEKKSYFVVSSSLNHTLRERFPGKTCH